MARLIRQRIEAKLEDFIKSLTDDEADVLYLWIDSNLQFQEIYLMDKILELHPAINIPEIADNVEDGD